MKEKQKEKLKYTMIYHEVRIEFDLSLAEYCVADSIYHLSHNPKSDIIGWCYASKKTLGDNLNLSRQSIHTILNLLEKKKLIERNLETKHIRTTQKWYDNVVLSNRQSVKKLDSNVSRNVTQDSKEMLHDNNINNNSDIDTVFSLLNDLIRKSRNTAPTRKAIANALKDFSVEDLEKIIKLKSEDVWFMENNARRGALWFFSSKARLQRWFDEVEIEEEKKQIPNIKYCGPCEVAHEVGKHIIQNGKQI